MCWRVGLLLIGAVVVLSVAYLSAQEKPPGTRPEPGPVPLPGERPEPRPIRALPLIGGSECAMEIDGGKIYLVAGNMVFKIDAEKMELEKKKDLTEVPITGSAEDVIKRMDKDADGKISKGEWLGAEQMFGKLDKNNDGFLTKDEIPAEMIERVTSALKTMAARSGRLAVKVDGPNLYIYKGGLLYKLKTEDLEIVKSLVLEETPEQKRSERAPKAPAPEGVEKKPPTKEGEKQ